MTHDGRAERTPQQERSIRTRSRILECAATLFDRHGYPMTTVGDIAKEAEVTRGALYYHFRDKQAVAAAIFEEQFEGMSVPPQHLRVQELVDATYLLVYGLRINPIQRGAARLTMEQGTDRVDRTRVMQMWIDFVVSILSEAQKQGEVRPEVDVNRASRYFVAAFAGVQNMSQAFTKRHDLDEYLTDMWQYTLPAIVSDGVMAKIMLDPERGAQLARHGIALAS
ncbi:ScbR family autoregulator-binding transcription factor [Streptomyces halobius]|uniref:TetR/AcrR family transcriptional regulator n=1 Tax=Streptomyces halobius TaxID=2879846 RepID=A0ABY4MB30_9ACTN|nr:ScbR family autoregulator-binding transcription factor [Streptomyces halobius]UQA94947.1 TetR/AcrR family transcriptional regulator [Streptomyces halobius]